MWSRKCKNEEPNIKERKPKVIDIMKRSKEFKITPMVLVPMVPKLIGIMDSAKPRFFKRKFTKENLRGNVIIPNIIPEIKLNKLKRTQNLYNSPIDCSPVLSKNSPGFRRILGISFKSLSMIKF